MKGEDSEFFKQKLLLYQIMSFQTNDKLTLLLPNPKRMLHDTPWLH